MGKGWSNPPSPDLDAPELSAGLRPSDLLVLPEPQSSVLTWMMRREAVTFAEVMAFLGQEEEQTRTLLDDLCGKGFVRDAEVGGVTQYRVRLSSRPGRARPSNLWEVLGEEGEQGGGEQ